MNDRATDLLILALVNGNAIFTACLVTGGALITLGVVLKRWGKA